MKIIDKLRYLGFKEIFRKYALKGEIRIKSHLLTVPKNFVDSHPICFHLKLLGHQFNLERVNRWHNSPDTNGVWPLQYSPTIPITGPKAIGDVKLVWELNRHQFLPSLVEKNPELVKTILRDWIVHNPFEFGVNWCSAMEVGLRLISWVETFNKAPNLRSEFAKVTDQHAKFVKHHISTDWIPRNNHLIGEAGSLVVYGNKFKSFGYRCLESAANEQFYPSGVNREQSVRYHHFVAHLLKIAGINNKKIFDYLSAIQQPDGTLPNLGDSDDGIASSQEFSTSGTPRGSVQFRDAGVYVIRKDANYCILRCGPFGLEPNYAHAHADLLSPIIWLRGIPVFIDSGTFTYNGDASLRKYFRSAHAHNVVVVDDLDFAEQKGTFAWKNVPVGICEKSNSHEICGSHNAYCYLGITIQRSIRYIDDTFIIHDQIKGTGYHRLRWRFHLHPHLKATHCGNDSIDLGEELKLTVSTDLKGKLKVVQGMYSPSYNRKIEIDVCEYNVETKLPALIKWVLK